MNDNMEVFPALRAQVAELVGSYPGQEAALILRALHKLYFDHVKSLKPTQRGYLLLAGMKFAKASGTLPAVDIAIFKEEADKYREGQDDRSDQ